MLFERRPRFALTYAGEVFYRYARRFGDLDEALRQEFADLSAGEEGALTVGVATTRGCFWMPRILAAFRRQYPKIQIRLLELANAALIEKLRAGEADLIMAYLEEPQPGIVAQKW